MWAFLAKAISWFFSIGRDPHVRIVMDVIGAMVVALPEGFLVQATMLVKAAGCDAALPTNGEKFSWVTRKLREQYPGMKENTIRVAVEALVKAVKEGL